MRIIFIRHGMTKGNAEKRYNGSIDEPLCEAGENQACALYESGVLPKVDEIIVSPLIRCRETAKRVFANRPFTICEDLQECNFGAFENRTAQEMKDDEAYQTWLKTGGLSEIPGGESIPQFGKRCVSAFLKNVEGKSDDMTIAFVIHGGTIMALLSQLVHPKRPFFAYYIPNCGYIHCTYQAKDGPKLTILEDISSPFVR